MTGTSIISKRFLVSQSFIRRLLEERTAIASLPAVPRPFPGASVPWPSRAPALLRGRLPLQREGDPIAGQFRELEQLQELLGSAVLFQQTNDL